VRSQTEKDLSRRKTKKREQPAFREGVASLRKKVRTRTKKNGTARAVAEKKPVRRAHISRGEDRGNLRFSKEGEKRKRRFRRRKKTARLFHRGEEKETLVQGRQGRRDPREERMKSRERKVNRCGGSEKMVVRHYHDGGKKRRKSKMQSPVLAGGRGGNFTSGKGTKRVSRIPTTL